MLQDPIFKKLSLNYKLDFKDNSISYKIKRQKAGHTYRLLNFN